MEVKKIHGDYWCVNCDGKPATVEISNSGSFHLYWAHGKEDGEICLCEKCFQQLKEQINSL